MHNITLLIWSIFTFLYIGFTHKHTFSTTENIFYYLFMFKLIVLLESIFRFRHALTHHIRRLEFENNILFPLFITPTIFVVGYAFCLALYKMFNLTYFILFVTMKLIYHNNNITERVKSIIFSFILSWFPVEIIFIHISVLLLSNMFIKAYT